MTQHIKTVEQQYQVLSELEHIRKRVGMYAGSPTLETRDEFIYDVVNHKMEMKKVSFIPALVKIISEAIDNVVDEHKRNPDKVNQLKLDFDGDEITIFDNGGIPVQIHSEFNKYVPEIIFGTLRSGSNYSDDEDQALVGTNGLGIKLCNVLSGYFIVETADGSKSFKQEFTHGMSERSEPIIKTSNKNYTKLTFKPDLEYFNLTHFDEDHLSKIVKRLVDVAGCNPKLKVFFNGQKINVKDFESYISLYSETYLFESYQDWDIGVAHSDGFKQTSFVNSVETYMGGTHIDYVANQIIASLREYFKKKHKVDVKPNEIKNHLHLFISCNINRPKFSSQTKENMISSVNDFNTSVKISDKFIKKIIGSEIIQSVLDWIDAKKQADLNAELRKHNKNTDKADPKSIPKFHDATTKFRKEASVFFVEGDSALSGVLSGRNPKIHGAFPLRGKPINVYEMDIKEVILNKEFKNILIILGLQLGVPVKSTSDLRFGKIVFTTDQDLDGYHIRGLLMNMLFKYWPEIFKLGMVYILNTPLVKVTQGKKIIPFYSQEEFIEWQDKNKGAKFTSKYFKGLGTSSSKEWKEYFSETEMDQNLVQLLIEDEEDAEMFKLLFSKEKGMTDNRKRWLDIAEEGSVFSE